MGGCLISLGIRKLEDEGYREAVDDEILTRCRLKVCREEGDREAVEKRLGFGQVEELIEEALENLNLIYMMLGPPLLWSPLSLLFCSSPESDWWFRASRVWNWVIFEIFILFSHVY